VAHPPAAPRAAHALGVLTDSHGRTIRDLRLSITDRCNFRCVYCMDPGAEFLPPSERLTPVELERLARLAASMGVERIRLTGGEPALHPRLIEIIERIASIQGVQVAMTTNGSRASARAVSEWKRAGLTRLTFSLDSLSPERFTSMSRSNADPHAVIDAVRGAIDAGLSPVKINAVIVRCFNEEEIVPLAGLARTLAVEVRFIEFMPLDAGRRWRRDLMVPASEILERISRFVPLVPFGRRTEHDTAERYGFADAAPGSIGIIASVTRPFCGACSRLRITADGKVRPCLFSEREWGLMPLLRDGADDADLRRFLVDATWTKQPGHGISSDEFAPPPRAMYSIGG
jgi:cyclic pyranopterin phosphate synthase